MAKNLEFELVKEQQALHWLNWEVFVDKKNSILNKKENNVCILFVCCKSFKSFIWCLDYLKKESNQNFDILVVDNSTNNENINLFHDVWKNNKKISILKPINNIGWSWWFSIGMEYSIQQRYEYLILFEDDIIPIDDDIISNTIKSSKLNYIIFNKNIFLKDGLPFHLNCYPVEFLREYWVVDPRMFLTYDDVQFAWNINRAIRSWKYKKTNSTKSYYHPMIKKNSQKCRNIYLSTRNSLMKCISVESITNIKEFALWFLMLFYWFSKWLVENCRSVLYSYLIWLFDFFIWWFWYNHTQNRLNKLFSYTISIPQNVWVNVDVLTISEIEKLTINKLDLYWKLAWGNDYFWNLKCSSRWIDWIKHWFVIAWFLNSLYPFFVLSNNVIFLEKYDFLVGKYEVSYYKSLFNKFNYFKLILSLLLSIVLYIPMYTLILLKVILWKIIKVFRK